jgi:D-sedoheptulose 7-phosphate isomerase
MKKLNNYTSLLIESLKHLEKDESKIENIAKYIRNCSKKNLKVLVAGNGGSCADAEHFVGELVCTFSKRNRKPISAINLASGTSALTAWANDFGFETFFERLTMAHGKKGDCIIFISTGGGNFKNKASINLISAAKSAKKRGMKVFSLVGKDGGYLHKNSDISIKIKSNITSIIQECHMTILHYICYKLEELI